MQNLKLTATNALPGRATIIDDPEHVEERLQELHSVLTVNLFRNAIIGGLSGRNEVTRASAKTAAGVLQWLKTVKDLRTLLAAAQWNIHDQLNCPFISSPDHAISIVVMTGNIETGKNGSEYPTNQAKKGTVAENFVQKNRQLELFNNESFEYSKEKKKETQVWVLLYHYDKTLSEVRFELSLPTGFYKKKITKWGERLILGRISNNPAEFTIHRDEPNAPATVDVEPKTQTS